MEYNYTNVKVTIAYIDYMDPTWTPHVQKWLIVA